MWHDGIIFTLTQNCILGNLLNLSCDFLNERKQRVVLHGKMPMPEYFKILYLLLYCFWFANDLTEGFWSNANLFADDRSLFSVIHDTHTSVNDLKGATKS